MQPNIWNKYSPVADPEGGQEVRLNPLPAPPPRFFFNILWKCKNLVSVRPNYFISMGYLQEKRDKSAKRTPTPLNI